MSTTKVLLGFVAGAAVGAVAGVLFAPDTGENTRKKIADKSGDWSDVAKETFSGIIDGIKNTYSGVKDKMEDFTEQVKTRMSAENNEADEEEGTSADTMKTAFS